MSSTSIHGLIILESPTTKNDSWCGLYELSSETLTNSGQRQRQRNRHKFYFATSFSVWISEFICFSLVLLWLCQMPIACFVCRFCCCYYYCMLCVWITFELPSFSFALTLDIYVVRSKMGSFLEFNFCFFLIMFKFLWLCYIICICLHTCYLLPLIFVIPKVTNANDRNTNALNNRNHTTCRQIDRFSFFQFFYFLNVCFVLLIFTL